MNLPLEEREPLLEPHTDGCLVLYLGNIPFKALLVLLNQIFPDDGDAVFYYICTMEELLLLVYICTGYRLNREYKFSGQAAYYFHTCARIYNRNPHRLVHLTLSQMPDKRAWRQLAQNSFNSGWDDDNLEIIRTPGEIWQEYLDTARPVRFEEMVTLIVYLLNLPRNDYTDMWRRLWMPRDPVPHPLLASIDYCHVFLQRLLWHPQGDELVLTIQRPDIVSWLPGLAEECHDTGWPGSIF